ncbi:MAG: penicillin-binding protein 2 [Candidatus Pelagibacter sp. TMED286]|nr:MAG: cell division protein FtsI [Pelagibacterales bacterium MED-G43]RPG95151.1 MAG: penicillin-binding protein 2 [Candidatus Pelagibacter sp. TMED286]
MKKKLKKNNNSNQTSFYFEDYLETNKKNKKLKKANNFQDRIYILFFFFFCLVLIFSIKITHISLYEKNIFNFEKQTSQFSLIRRDIVDRNGAIISRNINTFHAAVDPKLVKDKKNFLIKLRLNFPELPFEEIKSKLNQKKYFRLKKRIDQIEKDKFWALGEKAIKFEPFQARMYTHGDLFSHIVGQVDYDNYGISGLEKYFDKQLKNKQQINKPLRLTLDSNVQYIINKELKKAMKTFDSTGGGALLLDVNNGDIISLVSLPNFNINQRTTIKDKKFINKITKGVYELGSIFKTFTVALALENKLVETDTIIEDIPKKIRCSIHEITDIKEHPKNLSVEEILVRSSNVGSVFLAKKIGVDNYKKFIKKTKLTNNPEIELEEVGVPHQIKWDKCKLETISFGHGITTTPLQATALYAAMSNGGKLVIPSLIKDRKIKKSETIISNETSNKLSIILRKVVNSKNGTASLADKDGYYVGGKTGTAESYGNKKNRINTFISIFPAFKPNYALLVMLENPKINSDLIYNYRGVKTKAPYNTSGWNAVYVAGKIIEKIGPILAINNKEFTDLYVAEKFN